MAQTNNIAATITKADGAINVTRNGQEIILNQGDAIYATDKIDTQGSTIEITFADGAVAILAPRTVIAVQEFSYDAGDPSFVLNLTQGAMRSISGYIVENNPDAFKVTTPRATVGIRGTDYLVKLNPDGSETVVVLSLDQGHNVVVTTYTGEQISVNTINMGAFIPAGDDGVVQMRSFTAQEIQDLAGQLVSILGLEGESEDGDEGNDDQDSGDSGDNNEQGDNNEGSEDSTSEIILGLDAALIQALSAEGIDALDAALIDLGIDFVISNINADAIDYASEYAPEVSAIASNYVESSGLEEFIAGLTPVSTDGTKEFYPDGESITSSNAETINLISHGILITGSIDNANVTISGDVLDFSGHSATLNAGSDGITGSALNNGRVVGDAEDINAAVFNAGDDRIQFSSMGGGTIYGDIGHNITANTATWGDDHIAITGNMTAGSIYGDGLGVGNGNDYIGITGNMSNGSSINGGGGNDTIGATGLNDSDIYGGEGNDSITVGDLLNGSSIELGSGENELKVGTIDGDSSIVLDTGTDEKDTITIGITTSGDITGLGKGDFVSITNLNASGHGVFTIDCEAGRNQGDNVIINVIGAPGSDITLLNTIATDFILINGQGVNGAGTTPEHVLGITIYFSNP